MDADQRGIKLHIRFIEAGEESKELLLFVPSEVPSVVLPNNEFHIPFPVLQPLKDVSRRPCLSADAIQNRCYGKLPPLGASMTEGAG